MRLGFKAGQTYGKWKLKKRIGSGGNAHVYKSENTETGEIAAIKLLFKQGFEAYARFRDEIFAMELLAADTRVLPIIDKHLPKKYSKSDALWFVMPLADKLLDKLNTKRETDVLNCIYTVSQVVEYLHNQNMSHRDIKPSNILWYDGQPYLSDYGLVTYDDKPDVTRDRAKIGARHTIAPEMRHFVKGTDGKPADVYSLAKTLCMLLCQETSGFDGQYSSRSEMSLRKRNPIAQTDTLDYLLTVCTEHDASLRPSIDEFNSRLKECIDTFADLDKLSHAKWRSIAQHYFPESIPQTSIWSDKPTICDVLNLVGRSAKNNHMFFPDGGGMDLCGAEMDRDNQLIRLFYDQDHSGCYSGQPLTLRYESFNDNNIDWNYFRLDFSESEPSGVYGNRWSADTLSECYVELKNGTKLDLEYHMNGNWPEGSDTDGYLVVSRYRTGSIVIVHRRSPYNLDNATYDARHNAMTADQFRKYIERQIERLQPGASF